MSETDGIEEAFEGQLRVLVAAASQIGERVARGREAALRTAQARSEHEARDLQLRFAAECQAARAQLSPVHRTEWWDQANPHDISHAYQTARAWSQEDPEAVRAEQRIRDEVRNLYGVDVRHAGPDPEVLRRAVEQSEHNVANAGQENRRAAQEAAEAQRLMSRANEENRAAENAREAAEHEPNPQDRAQTNTEAANRARHDSADRRSDTAHDLETKGIDGEIATTRMRADVSNAKPATEAVNPDGQHRPMPKAKKSRGRGAQAQRIGRSR